MKNSRKAFAALRNTQPVNDPAKAGQLASRKVSFGDLSRFAVAAVHTRFDAVSWFVWDAEQTDDVTGGPAIVWQAATFAEAVGVGGKP